MPSLPKIRKSNFLPLLSTVVLLLSVFAGVILVQQQQELRERAATFRVPQDYSSIEAAYNAASHGDTILVAPGNYTVCLTGKRTKRIILRAQNPATTSTTSKQSILNSGCSHVIQFKTPLDNDGIFNPGEVVEFNGFVLKGSDDGFSYESASGIVKDNIITGQSDDPIDIDGASEAHIIGNILKDGRSGGDGIENRLHSFSSSRELRMIFRNNVIYNSKKDGIQFIDQTGSKTKRKYLIANNLIIGNGQAGIGTTKGGDSNQGNFPGGYALPEKMYVLHNTFVNNGWDGILGGANMKVHNNIFYKNGRAGLKNVSGGSVASHNLFFGNSPDHSGSKVQSPNVFVDPKFINIGLPPNFSSFQLGSGSPAIDAGKVVNSLYAEFGVTPPAISGSAPDLGWLESGFAPPPPPPTTPTPTPTKSPTPTPSGPTPTPPPIPRNAFRGLYYDNQDFTALTHTRIDPTIDFGWGLGSPAPSVGVDSFSVRWEGDWNFAQAGTYRFTAETDDGMRVWVDGQQIIDGWKNQPATVYTGDIQLASGTHRVKVDYYEAHSTAVARLSWALTSASTPSPSPSPPPTLPGDIDGDADVDIFDYNLLVSNFGATTCGNQADIDGDCDVDIFDYNTLVGNFGKSGG